MKKNLCCFFGLLLFSQTIKAQDFASWQNNSLILNNGLVIREIVAGSGGIFTKSLRLEGNDWNFAIEKSKEFSLSIRQAGTQVLSFRDRKSVCRERVCLYV